MHLSVILLFQKAVDLSVPDNQLHIDVAISLYDSIDSLADPFFRFLIPRKRGKIWLDTIDLRRYSMMVSGLLWKP